MPRSEEKLEGLPTAGVCAFLLFQALLLTGCMEDKVAGSTSTGNAGKGTISGRVLNAEGKGVANAKVRVLDVDHNPGPGSAGAGDIADVAVTAADGAFRTDSLADGRYNLLGDKDGNLSFRDSVAVESDSATSLAGDTLKPPGSVSGVVRLRPGHDSRTIFLILLGTTTLAVPKDSIGNFRLDNLAEGEYRLRLLSTLDAYKPLDTVITVRSGAQDTLPDTLRLIYQAPASGEIPLVDDVSMAYDTTKMAATLTWKKRDASKVAAYNVYRKHPDSAFAKLNRTPVADTVYVDDWRSGLDPHQTYHYAVSAVDPQGNEGRKGDPAVLTVATRFTIEMVIPGSDCGADKCNYDIDAGGNIWVAEINGAVVRHGFPGADSKWFDPLSADSPYRQIRIDPEGGVYLLYRNPLRVGKSDSAGNSLWLTPLPFDRDVAFTLHMVRDSLYVWAEEERIMTYLGKNGRILGQDTLLKSYLPPTGMSYPSYKPGIGFFTNTVDGIRFHDRDGRDTAVWKPESREYLRDFTRDESGRWYVSWSSGIVDVFSADRALLGSILAGGSGDLLYRNGALYMQTLPGNQLVRILPGF
jgi:hypothetical protein